MDQRQSWTNRQNFEGTAGNSRKAAEASLPRDRDRQDGGHTRQDEINAVKKKLYDIEGRSQKLEGALHQTSEKLKKKKAEITFNQGEIEDLMKKIQEFGHAKEDLRKEKEEIDVAIKEADDQIATLTQSRHQTGNREKMDNKVTRLKELLKEKDKQLCKANISAKNYEYSLQQLEDTQSALEATKLLCDALEEELKRKTVERDEHHLQELSEREDVLRKELCKQEERFKEELANQKERFVQELADREAELKQQLSEKEEAFGKDLSEQEERSKKKLAHLEDNLKQQFSEVEESYRKVFSEHEQGLKKKFDNMTKQLVEKEENFRKELSDRETEEKRLVTQRNEQLQLIREEEIQQELLIEEAKKQKKKGFWKRLFKRKKKTRQGS